LIASDMNMKLLLASAKATACGVLTTTPVIVKPERWKMNISGSWVNRLTWNPIHPNASKSFGSMLLKPFLSRLRQLGAVKPIDSILLRNFYWFHFRFTVNNYWNWFSFSTSNMIGIEGPNISI
jgi:hypothetical protein